MVVFTPELLRKLNRKYSWDMCKSGYLAFKKAFPEGIEVSARGWKKANNNLNDFSWFREMICMIQYNDSDNCICGTDNKKEFLVYLRKLVTDYEKAAAARKKK